MCCRLKIAKVLTTTFSVLVALGGLVVISFCFKLILDVDDIFGDSDVTVADKSEAEARTTDLIPENVSPASDARRADQGLNEISTRIAIIAFVVGISAVVMGLAGICTAKIHKCPCTCVFGFLIFLFMALYGFSAFLLLSLYYVSDSQITDFCNNDLNLEGTEGLFKRLVREVEDYVYTVDSELSYAVDGHMCTDFCPCQGGWDYSLYGQSNQLKFNEQETNQFNFEGEQTTFTECYAQRNTLWVQQEPDRQPIDTEVISLMKTFEQDYECSGFCKHATFWASKDIREGPPKQACIYSLKESFDENMVLLGWATVATTALALLVFCCHCGLYLHKADTGQKKGMTKKKFIFD